MSVVRVWWLPRTQIPSKIPASSTGSATPEILTLRDGIRIHTDALRWLWTADTRGLDIRLADDRSTVLVEPARQLTIHDRRLLRDRRDEISAVVWWIDGQEADTW